MTLTQTESFENSTTVRTNVLLRAAGLALRTTDRFAPRLAARMAANLFLTPRRNGRPPRERHWIRNSERRERTINGRKIVTWSWGDGAPVLLIHGWEGRGSQMGAFAHSAGASGYRWIGVDLPAHGDSTGKQTNLIEIAAVIRELVEDLNPSAIIAH